MVSGMYSTLQKADSTTSYPMLEMILFEESREIMGAKFPKIIEYYLEDMAEYLSQMQHDLAANAHARLMVPLHTITSSSRQLGAMAVAETARAMEECVRNTAGSAAPCPPELAPMLLKLRQQFEALKPVLHQHLADMR